MSLERVRRADDRHDLVGATTAAGTVDNVAVVGCASSRLIQYASRFARSP
jgi:hypothetical protein